MHILEVEYTAALVKSVAILTGKTTREVTAQIGAKGVARLMHNAPMNQLLQYGRIVGEIIHDYDFHAAKEYDKSALEPDRGYGYYISALVAVRTQDHHAFPEILYNILTETE